MELNNIYIGDCLELMKQIPASSIDMVLCDLPYGMTACKWDAVISFDLLWEQYERIAKLNCPIVLTSCQPFTSALISSNFKMFKHEWIWEKTSATGHLNASRSPMRAHESVSVFCKGTPTYNPQKTQGHPRKTTNETIGGSRSDCYGSVAKGTAHYDSTERFPRSVIKFAKDKQRQALHPTQKPVALFEYLIKTYSNEGETVLDNCIGSGTTAVACLSTGRNFIGMEHDEKHHAVACKRVLTLSTDPANNA